MMLVGDSYGGDQMNYMWSPSCLLEGQAHFAGEPMRLFLYDNGFSGSFNVFGSGAFALVPVSQTLEGYMPRDILSTLICRDGKYYKLSLDGSHEKGKTLQVKIQKDTSPTGRTAFGLKGKEPLKTRLTSARIAGASDKTIQFNTGNAQTVIPVGQYKLSSGYVCYGVESDDQWQVNFDAGPAFTIAEDETTSGRDRRAGPDRQGGRRAGAVQQRREGEDHVRQGHARSTCRWRSRAKAARPTRGSRRKAPATTSGRASSRT